MDAVSAECVSVTPCGLEVPVIVLWTTAHVWRATSRSVTAEERVNVALANALTPNSRVPPVRPALPVQESVLNTSKSEMKTCHCTNTNTNTHMYVISYVLQESFLLYILFRSDTFVKQLHYKKWERKSSGRGAVV